jgi:hypothetical protein
MSRQQLVNQAEFDTRKFCSGDIAFLHEMEVRSVDFQTRYISDFSDRACGIEQFLYLGGIFLLFSLLKNI